MGSKPSCAGGATLKAGMETETSEQGHEQANANSGVPSHTAGRQVWSLSWRRRCPNKGSGKLS